MSRADRSPNDSHAVATDGAGIAELSRCAVRYGEGLVGLPVAPLARRIYDFGRRPLSARLRRQFPDAAAVTEFVESTCGSTLRRDWRELPATPHWQRWAAAGTSGRIAGKLYVSVAPQALPEAVAVVAGMATSSTIAAFKVGANAAGVCRADRLIVYVSAAEDVQPLGTLLGRRLAGCPADGVPFTAAITTDGLVSWAIDPSPGTSWRLWLTDRLARHLHDAASEGAPHPGLVALDRLRRDGVNTEHWAPVTG